MSESNLITEIKKFGFGIKSNVLNLEATSSVKKSKESEANVNIRSRFTLFPPGSSRRLLRATGGQTLTSCRRRCPSSPFSLSLSPPEVVAEQMSRDAGEGGGGDLVPLGSRRRGLEGGHPAGDRRSSALRAWCGAAVEVHRCWRRDCVRCVGALRAGARWARAGLDGLVRTWLPSRACSALAVVLLRQRCLAPKDLALPMSSWRARPASLCGGGGGRCCGYAGAPRSGAASTVLGLDWPPPADGWWGLWRHPDLCPILALSCRSCRFGVVLWRLSFPVVWCPEGLIPLCAGLLALGGTWSRRKLDNGGVCRRR
jgi:hypothetical protein